MKLLRIAYKNIDLFDDGFEIDLTTADKVIDSESATNIFRSIYSQNVISFVGANASGKTTALKLIKAAISIVISNQGLDQIDISPGILKDESVLTVDFFNDDKFYRLESKIGIKNNLAKQEYYFIDEVIYYKNKSEITSKKSISEFKKILRRRSELEESLTKSKIKLLKPQDSIAVTVNENSLGCYDTLFTTNFNIYIRRNQQVMPFVNLFDDSIESLSSSDDEIVIKFKNDDRIYRSNNLIEAENFLSSGTIKGSNLITYAMMVMQTGGYLIVDEIENHLHKKLVQTIINLFNDNKINRNGATLIFSTHYSEIIDCLNRKDNIFIMLRNNKYISSAVRYSKLVKRNDVKKSEVLISNYIDGTAPNYESIKLVREMLCGFKNC